MNTLPDAVLIYCVSFLDIISVMECAKVCKRWNDLFTDNDKIHKYVTESQWLYQKDKLKLLELYHNIPTLDYMDIAKQFLGSMKKKV